jgi:4a-hydroxytetrahydrobiopterin dehydratase
MTTQPRALTDDEIRERLAARPEWKIVSSPQPDDASKVRVELCRTFRLPSFERALEFMQTAVPFIAELDHHPRWENTYRDLVVCLTTHDLGSRVSALDFELAKYLDGLSVRFMQSEP